LLCGGSYVQGTGLMGMTLLILNVILYLYN
jgi:hypothetical protein